MALDEDLNKILKEMWKLDEKLLSGSFLAEEEKNFYNQNLKTIQEYYLKNSKYWQAKENV